MSHNEGPNVVILFTNCGIISND